MVIGKSDPCSSSGIGALVLAAESEALFRLAGRWAGFVWAIPGGFRSGLGEFWPEGEEDGEGLILCSEINRIPNTGYCAL